MSHEVYRINGKDSMAFVGMTPWHGLGQQLDPKAPLEVWAKEAQLDWTVKAATVNYEPDMSDYSKEGKVDFGDVQKRFMENRVVLYRSDNGHPLSVVSNIFKPVQPIWILEFFRSLIEKHGFRMNTAGSLRYGQRIWALAETGDACRVMGQDELKAYLLLATACDGSLSTIAQFTTVRVVCNNTLSLAYAGWRQRLKEAAKQDITEPVDIVRIPHNAVFDPDSVKFDLGLAEDRFKAFAEDVDEMAQTPVTKEEAVEYFVKLLSKKEDDFSDVPERTFNNLWQVYQGGVGQDLRSAKDTVWGLVTAVTRFQDHERQAQSQGTRLDSSWFGNGNRLKNRAYLQAQELLKAA